MLKTSRERGGFWSLEGERKERSCVWMRISPPLNTTSWWIQTSANTVFRQHSSISCSLFHPPEASEAV